MDPPYDGNMNTNLRSEKDINFLHIYGLACMLYIRFEQWIFSMNTHIVDLFLFKIFRILSIL